ncbi:MAG: prepilin-type N-terminal cleavage/methylation domain-containing protein [Oligoflexia bacterium]|nr:prepilin-type N-terminal cleavage/methylation domain-containing protein [Oligoflexia bacterium]
MRTPRVTHSSGFTLVELLVSMGLTAVVMTLVLSGVLAFRTGYYQDIVRTRINGNLRSAMDIISMNVRQAGENLQSNFPAIILTNGSASAADTLKLRRNLVPEILTLCTTIAAGASTLAVSSASTANAECVPANVAPLYTVFEGLRNSNGGSMRVFIYDRSTRTGEFVDYSLGTFAGGQYSITISAAQHAYTQLNTGVYIVEEYAFEVDAAQKTLNLYIDDQRDTPQAVAFGVTNFQVSLEMSDHTTLSAFTQSSGTQDWKDIEQIDLTLNGEDSYRGETITSSISAQYFPRNVLSFDG